MRRYDIASKQEKNVEPKLNKQISALKFVSRKSRRTESRTTMAKMQAAGISSGDERRSFRQR
jgi:hypothetical protein